LGERAITKKFVKATVQAIVARGWLKCGAEQGNAIFGNVTAGTAQGPGFWADICRAHAAALFPDFGNNQDGRLRFTIVSSNNRFLPSNGADVVAFSTTKTAHRLVNLPIFFGPIIIHDGGAFAVRNTSGITAANVNTITGKKLCFDSGSTHAIVTTRFPNFIPVPLVGNEQAENAYRTMPGTCDAVASDLTSLISQGFHQSTPTLGSSVLNIGYSRSP
jgi:ABC-type amino acid transport substrate-binding protein